MSSNRAETPRAGVVGKVCRCLSSGAKQRIFVPSAEAAANAAVASVKKYPPTPEEIREWMDRKGLSNKDVAKALQLSDGRVVRFWTSKKDPRPMPYPSWYTLRHKFGK
jgi:hypothetical protein